MVDVYRAKAPISSLVFGATRQSGVCPFFDRIREDFEAAGRTKRVLLEVEVLFSG